jgi:hypothetical protein
MHQMPPSQRITLSPHALTELVEELAGEIDAGQVLEAVAQARRRRGYRDL